MDPKFIGKQIRNKRKQLGLLQDQLAESADLSTVALSNIERGQKQVRLDSLVRIADSLGSSIDELLGRESPDSNGWGNQELQTLWSCSTPREQRIILAITRAFLESIREN